MTTKLHKYLVKDTGVELSIRKVSPNILLEFQKNFDAKYPLPEVPTQAINYGDEKHPDIRQEKNESHPDYKQAIAERKMRLNNEMQTLLIRRGVVVELTKEQKDEVKELREFWKSEYEQVLPADDKEVFVRYIALGTREDLTELVEAVTRRTMPTEGAISEQLKSS
jgi:hypothetical protein